MTIPTRFIDKAEYDKLINMEPSYIMIHQLDAMDFVPPTNGKPDPDSITSEHVHLLFLNATEPCIYWDKEQGGPFVILPKHDELTYEVLQEIHPVKGSWAYRLSPHNWDERNWENHDLQYTDYWFKPSNLEPYDEENGRTH